MRLALPCTGLAVCLAVSAWLTFVHILWGDQGKCSAMKPQWRPANRLGSLPPRTIAPRSRTSQMTR